MSLTNIPALTPQRVDALLAGSPYSVPIDADSRAEVIKLLESVEELTRRANVAQERLVEELRGLLGLNRRSREIYESNQIEHLGPDFATTVSILNSPDARRIKQAADRYGLIQAVATDAKMMDVLGLHGAKLLAEDLVSDSSRRLTQVDIRTMHKLVLGEQSAAGTYRQGQVEITGSRHTPCEWYDIQPYMNTLAQWVHDSREGGELPPVLIAAVAHAWLTHIHPFGDGNGRMARLWANMIIAGTGLPALIIRSQPDRGHYLDALSLSDEAGEIAALVRVFLRALRRGVREMENPQFAIDLFEDELHARNQAPYDRWVAAIHAWLLDMGVAMAQQRCDMFRIGLLDAEAFARYAEGQRMSAVILAEIVAREDSSSRVVLVLRRPSAAMQTRANGNPAIQFYRRCLRSSFNPVPYQLVNVDLDEVVVQPAGNSTYRTDIRTRDGRIQFGYSGDLDVLSSRLAGGLRAGNYRDDWAGDIAPPPLPRRP